MTCQCFRMMTAFRFEEGNVIHETISRLEDIFGSFDSDTRDEVEQVLDVLYDDAYEEGFEAGLAVEE